MAKRKTFEDKKAEFIKSHLDNSKWGFTEEWFNSLSDEDLEMLIETNLKGLQYNNKRVVKKYLSLRTVKEEKVEKKEDRRGEISYTSDQIKIINTILKSKNPTSLKVKTSKGEFAIANKGISFNALDSDGKKVKVAGGKIIEIITE